MLQSASTSAFDMSMGVDPAGFGVLAEAASAPRPWEAFSSRHLTTWHFSSAEARWYARRLLSS